MKNLLLLALALFCPLAVAQTPVPVAPISGVALNQYGQPIPYAQIRVCEVTSTGIPCTPTAQLYQDYYLTIPISNPISADQYGNYLAYVGTASPVNLYTIQVSATQGLTWSYVENGPATGGGGGGGTVTLVSCGNLYPLFTCSVANPNSTPAISFALSTAANFSFFGNFSGAVAAPSFWTLDAGTGIRLTPSGNILTIAAEPPQQFTVFQQNGINVPDQSLLNASNTTPAAPSGYQNVAWQNDSSGDWSAYYASILLELQQQITPPNGVTQYLILYPTTVTTSGDQESNTVSASTQSSYIVHPECGLGSCYEGSIYANFGGFLAALTAYGVNISQVTAVYPFTTSATDGCVAYGYFPSATVTWANSSGPSSGTLFNASAMSCPGGNVPLAYYLDSTSIGTGSSLADVTMQSTVSSLDPDQGGINLTTSAVGVIVAYIGTPVTVPSYIGVEPPLQLSSASGQTLLGIDPNAVFPITLGNATILGNSTTTMDSVLTLTTTGSSGAATLSGNTLNIPEYSGGGSVSITSSTGDLTVSPSPLTGTGTIDLNLGFANTWIAAQTFNAGLIIGSGQSLTNTGVSNGCATWASGVLGTTGSACGSGGSGISGLTAGYIPLAGSATTITGDSHIDDGVTTSGILTATEPFAVNSSGASQAAFTYNGTPTVGSSTTAVYAVSSGGVGELSNAGAAFSPLCTQATGCPSSGSTAFSALTGSTNTTAAMLVGSGASLGYTGSGTVDANELLANTLPSLATGYLNWTGSAWALSAVSGSATGVCTEQISNTGSDIGAQLNSAFSAMGSAGGRVCVAGGTYPMSTTATMPYVTDSVIGVGSVAAVFDCTVAGDCFADATAWSNPDSITGGGEIANFQIIGNGASGQVLFHAKDASGQTIHDIFLDGTSGTPSAVCMEFENVVNWTERIKTYNIQAGSSCTEPYLLAQDSGDSNVSFGENDFDFGAAAISVYAVTFGGTGSGDLYNGTLHIRSDNHGTNGGILSFTNSWKASNETVQLDVEQNTGSGASIFDIGSSTAVNLQGWVNNGGPASPLGTFCTGSCTSANFTFNGIVNNSAATQVWQQNLYASATYPAAIAQDINTYSGGSGGVRNELCSNLPTSSGCDMAIGESATATNNGFNIGFYYAGSGSSSNTLTLSPIGGSEVFGVTAGGNASIPAGNLSVINSTAGTPTISATNSGSANDVGVFSGLCSGLTSGKVCYFIFGEGDSTNNAAGLNFTYNSSGSTTNAMNLAFYAGSNPQYWFATGDVSIGDNIDPGATLGVGSSNQLKITSAGALSTSSSISGATYLTASNCSSSASPAVCGSAAAGTVQVASTATTLTVDTTAVTASSEIFYAYTTAASGCSSAPLNIASLLIPYTSAITAGTSFTITLPVAPTTNAACVQYRILN